MGKWLDEKTKVHFKIYHTTTWKANNCNTHIAQHLTTQTKDNWIIKLGQSMEYNVRNTFLQKSYIKWARETSLRPLFICRKKLYIRWKHVLCTLVLIYFDSSRLGLTKKKRLWHRCFPVNFAKFLKISFFTEHLCWLLLFF